MFTIKKYNSIESFETTRLLARKVVKDDFDLVFSFYKNQQLMASIGGTIPENVARERFQGSLNAWLERGYDAWLWFLKESNQLIGRGGLHNREIDGKDSVALGYVIYPEFWNTGYATEIALASTEIAIAVLKVDKVFCSVEITNKPSLRVIEKSGFTFLKEINYVGELHALYSLERTGQ